MWSDMIVFLPVASIMATVNIPEEFKMEGDLQDELDRILNQHLKAVKLIRNKKLSCSINASYPEQSNLWTVFDGILQRYQLTVILKPMNGTLGIRLEEGSAWKHKS